MAELGSTFIVNGSSEAPAAGFEGAPTGASSYGYSNGDISTFIEINTERESTVVYPLETKEFLVEGLKRYYRLRGYYAVGATYETWVTRFPADSPPSGHSLQNITVVDTWTE